MTLSDAAKHYMVYLQATRVPANARKAAGRALSNMLAYYGGGMPLEELDNSVVLDYISQNDPFDCDPVHEERGNVFCEFVQWLMQNKLIPAWAEEWAGAQRWSDPDGRETLDNLQMC